MLNASYERDLIRSFDAAGLTHVQRLLLRRVLLAVQPTAYLSWHAASANTSVIAVPNARTALHSRTLPPRGGGEHQPRIGLAYTVQKGALAAVDLLRATHQAHPGIVNAHAVLMNIVNTGPQGLVDPMACGQFVARLDNVLPDLIVSVNTLFENAWDQGSTQQNLDRIAVEIAALCLRQGRTHDCLKTDLETALRRGETRGSQILETIFSYDQRYRATVVVDGTHELMSLGALMEPDAEPHQFPLGSAPSGPGHRMPRLQQFVQQACGERQGLPKMRAASSDGAVVLSFWVTARDSDAAAMRGRRQMVEVLDQYVAGNRLSDLRLGPETMISSPALQKSARFIARGLRRDSVRPLTTHWPAAIRECLRTAHIASTTEAPMARTGLSWVALESFGLKHGDVGKLSNVLSLLALRQQLVGTHDGLRNTVKGTLLSAEQDANQAAETLRRLEEHARKAEETQSTSSAALAEKLEATRDHARARKAHLIDLQRKCNDPLRTIDTYCTLTKWYWLEDINRWLLSLEPLSATSPADLADASSAVSTLCAAVDGLATTEVGNWRFRMANLPEVANWLKECQSRFEAMLSWFYAVRNLSLHTGSFESASDELDAYGASSLVDMTLEFLGNWYQAAAIHEPAKAHLSAMQIIDELSDRQQRLITNLETGCQSQLNAQHLTSPTSTGWDRP